MDFDGVVIGAGHNGLTTAAYLARAGLKIAVLERNPRIGGGCSTESTVLPGFRLNLHANFYMGMSHCPLIEDLELYRYGFSYIEPPVQQAAVFRDGTGIVIYKDVERSCASLARFSGRTPRPSARSGTRTASRCGHCSPRCSTTRRCRASNCSTG
jgi:phytoene dehydrogenase-like protein